MDGIFGDIFDFNGDGQLDLAERAAELMFLDTIIEEEENDEDDE